MFGSKCDSCPSGKILSTSGCIPSVTDDYNRLISSDVVDTSITSSIVSHPSMSNINDDNVKLNSFNESTVNVNTGNKKKRKKGLGKKKNRKKKKVKPTNLHETVQPPQ